MSEKLNWLIKKEYIECAHNYNDASAKKTYGYKDTSLGGSSVVLNRANMTLMSALCYKKHKWTEFRPKASSIYVFNKYRVRKRDRWGR